MVAVAPPTWWNYCLRANRIGNLRGGRRLGTNQRLPQGPDPHGMLVHCQRIVLCHVASRVLNHSSELLAGFLSAEPGWWPRKTNRSASGNDR
jgi:hypothetical protein